MQPEQIARVHELAYRAGGDLRDLARLILELEAERDRYREALEHAREYLSIIDTRKGQTAIAGIVRDALDEPSPPCGAPGHAVVPAAELVEALTKVTKLGEDLLEAHDALSEYADHQSWRCGHPDRYPWDPDCPCGLVSTLAGFGIKVEPVEGKVYQ